MVHWRSSAMEAAVQPETRYARLEGDRVAYRVLGEGPPELVMTAGNYSHVDMVWGDPGIALFLRTLASFSRLIVFDRRGTGASDPLPPDALPHWEAYPGWSTPVIPTTSWPRAARCSPSPRSDQPDAVTAASPRGLPPTYRPPNVPMVAGKAAAARRSTLGDDAQ
jgi:pimeloyl-ACP methyl ester carboxylesterase